MTTTITQTTIIEIGLFFVFIFLSGLWLSRSGKPYSALKFNLHKLIGLAAGVFLILTVYRAAPLSAAEIAAVTLTVLFFAVTVAAGGLLSVAASSQKPLPPALARAILPLHKLFPYLAVLSTAATLYLLLTP